MCWSFNISLNSILYDFPQDWVLSYKDGNKYTWMKLFSASTTVHGKLRHVDWT